ncbi:MAG: histidine kinase, partial [Actinomycetota bacterium]|nr:histidine kinase [Actinomycetota bacterium]
LTVRPRLAWVISGAAILFLLVGLVVMIIDPKAKMSADAILFPLAVIPFALVGGLVSSRRPDNSIGWVMSAAALAIGLSAFGDSYARFTLVHEPGVLPGGPAAAWITNLAGSLFFFLALTYTLQLFPTGEVLSRRWKPALWWTHAALFVLVFGLVFSPGPMEDLPFATNPLGLAGAPGDVAEAAAGVGWLMTMVSLVLAVISISLRWRRSRAEERQQLKWLVGAGILLVLSMAVAFPTERWEILVLPLAAVPVAAGIAILKYRLYDIDVVINKTIVFGVLAAFITTIYVAIVVGIGTLLGSSDEPNLALSIAATAVVAIAFSPVRDRVQKLANRLVYGKRQTPYEAIARFADEVVSSYETHQVAPAIATTIAEATGAAQAHVWLKVDDTLVCEATHPQAEHTPHTVALNGDDLPALDGVDLAVAVVHNKELLGALTLAKKKGEPPQPQDRKLLDDLSSQAGIVLANARMTAELEAHLAHITAQAKDIKQSRQRIVAAQDKERRRLERDIHDGAQQHLVALAVKLNLAKTTAQRKPDKAPALLAQLKGDTQEALATLSDLAKGIYPPVLKDHGIATALKPIADKAPFEVTVDDRTTGRFGEAVEAAVYFCCLEALQNTAKYARATHATVTLTETDDTLGFVVTDDGAGFDTSTTSSGTGTQGMADRLAALDGTLTVTSAPGRGTTVTGTLPVRKRVEA